MVSRLVVGCGYVGLKVASKWLQRGDTVFAITRSLSRADDLSNLGIRPIIWDWIANGPPVSNPSYQNFAELGLPELATILIAVSHAPQPNIPHLETHTRGLNHLTNLLKTLGSEDVGRNQSKWIYLSTTGVFEQSTSGEWVDEDSPVSPTRPGSIAALAGEQWIAQHVSDDRSVVLRPVGIYGPERVPRWQSVRDSIPLEVDPESYLNLIHVDDLAATIDAVSTTNMRFPLYCVSDGAPVRRQDYYEYVASLGNWPSPKFTTPKPSLPGRLNSRSDGNKRVRNQRIKTELGLRMQYPSYRTGLRSLIEID